MADNIERTIYKLEIDDSGYIRGVESMSASTKRFAEAQAESNRRLQANESALRQSTQFLAQAKKDLDSYTGTNEKYRQQLLKTFTDAEKEQAKLNELVIQNRRDYEAATKAALDFASISQRASQLQPQPGARVPIPSVVPVTSQQLPLLNQLRTTVAQTAFSLGDLPDVLKETIPQFEKLRQEILLSEQALAGFNEESEEFKQLKPVIDQGRIVLEQYDAALKEAEESTKSAGAATQSIRTQLRQAREELVKLEQAGKGATKEYFELEKRTARLTDAFNDQQQRIKILASDTKLLDFGKASITAATSAFQAYTAVSILVGDQSEELQKKTMQLFAAMQLLQSLEQLSNLTRREGVLATLAQSGAQTAYTAVIGASTGALKAFRIALAATGIGLVIGGIAFLISKLSELKRAQDEVRESQKLLNDVNEEAVKNFTQEVVHLQLIKNKLNDLSIPQKDRVRLAKEYNKTADEGNKIDLKQIDNIKLVNAAIDTQIEKIKERAFARAAENILVQRSEDLFLAQEKARAKAQEDLNDAFAAEFDPKSFEKEKAFAERRRQEIVKASFGLTPEGIAADPDVKKAQAAIDKALQILGDKLNIDDLIQPTKTKDTKKAENEFAKRLAELQAKLAEVTAKSFESNDTIRKQFQASLEKEISEIKAISADKLTPEQKEILIDLVVRINDVQLNEALDQFNKKVTDARKKLNDEINELQNKNILDSLNLIQNEFDRRAAVIDFNEQKELADAKKNNEERLAALNLERLLIGEQAYHDAKNKIIAEGELEANNIIRQANLDRQDLAADVFKKSLDNISNVLLQQLLNLDENTAGRIQNEKDQLAKGIINYDEYQKNITKILREQKEERDRLRLRELNNELFSINQRIEKTTSLVEKEELQKRTIQIRSQIAEIKSQTNVIDPNAKRVETVQQYAEAIGQITDSIVSFWQKANEAEQQALQRSIDLQEERVQAAQRIAERGNAQYLKAEEDRLKELQVARENAARRDLAINAALQSSQLLVGITGAISKIATPGIGIAETIGAIAVIVAALGTGYGLVKSLQGNQPRLFKGTPEVKREGQPAGIDTIPAWLTEGEAVIPQDKNKKYKKSVEAIYHGKIPARVLNEFVENYTGRKEINKKNILAEIFNKSNNQNFTVNKIEKILKSEKNDEIINKLVNEKISKGIISSDFQKSLIEKSISINEIAKYSELISKITDKSDNKKSLSSKIENILKDEIIAKKRIETINKLINEKVIKGIISSETKNSLVNKDTSLNEVYKYSELVNKSVNENVFRNFVSNISKTPAKIIDKFIQTYSESKNRITIKNIIEDYQNIQDASKEVLRETDHIPIISSEKLKTFTNNYHSIKEVPQINFQRVKEAAELKISSDGKMAVAISEQNKLIQENNDLQRQTLRALKSIGVNVNIDKDGLALSVMEVAEQIKKDKRV